MHIWRSRRRTSDARSGFGENLKTLWKNLPPEKHALVKGLGRNWYNFSSFVRSSNLASFGDGEDF
jgi:hypothetical protein